MRGAPGLAALALLAACSSQAPEVTPAAAIPKADYISRGDAVCDSFATAVAELGDPPNASEPVLESELAPLATYLMTAQPLFTGELAALRALPPPSTDVAAAAAVVTADDVVARDLTASIAAAAKLDAGAFTTAFEAFDADTTKVETLQAGFGYKICGADT